MAEIRHLENRHDVIFSAEGGLIWIKKIRRLVQNDMSTAVIWSKSYQYGAAICTYQNRPIWRTFGRIPWRVIPEPAATLQVLPFGEFTVMIPEPHTTLQGVIIPAAILKIVLSILIVG